MNVFRSKAFWLPAGITAVISSIFFAWELGKFKEFIPSLPRPDVSTWESVFVVLLTVLLSLNVGLFQWQKSNGTCPIGAKRASGIAGSLGALALVCPVCVLLPFTIFGVSVSLAILGPFIPLLQILSMFLLLVSAIMMRPR